MRETILRAVREEKLVVILRGVPKDKLIPLAEAMWQGGVRLLEVTYDASGKTPDSETAEGIRRLVEHFGDRMYIGAGTVLTTEQVDMTRAAGGQFIISPDVCVEVIRRTRELGLVSMPGALTPSEMQTAHRAGADFIKLFPATNFGPDYIKAVSAPLSHLTILAVGGVDESNMADYLKVGVGGFGVGSNIVDKKMLAAEDWDGITRMAARYVAIVKA